MLPKAPHDQPVDLEKSEEAVPMSLRSKLRYGGITIAVIFAVAIFTIIPQVNFDKLFPSSAPVIISSAADSSVAVSEDISSVPSVISPSKEPIFNPISAEEWITQPEYDPELYQELSWSKTQVLDYLEKGFRPEMPSDLKGSEQKSWSVIAEKETDEIVYDFFRFSYAENFNDTYQPDRRRLTIGVSKLGVQGDYRYIIEEELLSLVDGVEIILGERELEDGCVVMVAYFTAHSLQYEVICENFTQEEFIRVLKSIA